MVAKLCGAFYLNKIHKAWLAYIKPGFVGLMLLIWPGLSCCSNQSSTTEKVKENLPPITQITTELKDEVKELPDEQISWSTYWKLCWAAYPGAQAYEIQIATSEGISPRLKKQQDTCYQIQIATGTNNKELGMVNKDKLVQLQSGQLIYKVRALLHNNQYSEWSSAILLADTSP